MKIQRPPLALSDLHFLIVYLSCIVFCQKVKSRYFFTILANLSVFMLYLMGSGDAGPRRFRFIAVTTLIVGSVCSLLFLTGTHERFPRPQHRAAVVEEVVDDEESSGLVNGAQATAINGGGSSSAVQYQEPHNSFQWYHWFAVPDFFLVGMIYMFAR